MATNGIVIGLEGTPCIVRVVPHQKDASKLVLKSVHPEAGAAMAHLMGIECSPVWQGRNFFMTAIDRQEFAAAFPKMVVQALPAGATKLLPAKCGDCGVEDGAHWQFCSNHNNKLN